MTCVQFQLLVMLSRPTFTVSSLGLVVHTVQASLRPAALLANSASSCTLHNDIVMYMNSV